MIDYSLFLPEFLLTGLAFLVFALDMLITSRSKDYLAYVSAVGLVIVMLVTLSQQGFSATLYNGLFVIDGYALFFKELFLAIAFFIVLVSVEWVRKNLRHAGEYYGLILFSTLAMMLMASSGELLTAYVSLELLSFSLYVLAAYAKSDAKSNEAGLKYILLGAFSSALLLYGISLIYGLSRTTSFEGIATVLQASGELSPALLASLVLIIAGFGFKIAAVPFHMWVPDVYEGSPLPVTAYLSVASKAAGLALMIRLFATGFMPVIDDWRMIIAVLAAVTMTVGNLVAIQQRNIKRLLAYSSISQVGFLLVGVAALSPMAISAILFHLTGYAVTNLAAFLCVIAYHNLTGKDDIPDYAGLAERAPFIAMSMAVALFSLAGLPIFAGFVTKFYLFAAAAKEGLLWLVAIAVVNSLISLYYYLLVIKQMYIGVSEERSRFRVPVLTHSTLGMLTVGVILVGIYPAPLVDAIDRAAKMLFS